MGKYEEMSKKALEALGGIDNITHVTHCATRLRIDYKKKNLIDEEALNTLPNSAGIVNKQGQIQIIIGPGVHDAYEDFLTVSNWNPTTNAVGESVEDEDEGPHNFVYWLNRFGNFVAPIFMPVVPAMITGGLILAIKNLLVNYFGFTTDSGTAQIMIAIFDAGFTFLPVYIGYTLASQLKMQPITGAFLGALLISTRISGVEGLSFLGIAIPTVSYGSTVLPIVLGVFFMYWVDKGLKKIIPEALIFFLKPLLTMIIVAPVTLIVLGPLGTTLSGYVANFVVWLTSSL
ncbi:MAG: PTS transporter subunit EIIC, partial [Longicatena sp.]